MTVEPPPATGHAHGATRLAGLVYGTIVVLSVVVASSANPDLGRVLVLVVSTCVVLWLAHVYAHALAESIVEEHTASVASLASIARREAAIVLAAGLPCAAIALGALDVLEDGTALWVAFGLGATTLVVQGLAYARLERLSRTGTIVAVGVNVAVALLLVGLKVLVSH